MKLLSKIKFKQKKHGLWKILILFPLSIFPLFYFAKAPESKTVFEPNYGEALQKSILFYEAQQSGKLPEWNRIPWRSDATLKDGKDVGLDLTGGWFDAGDLVKFGLPMATSVTMLSWGGIEYRDAFQDSDQLIHLEQNIKWVTDYFLKAFANDTPGEYVFYGQVGNGKKDHKWWGAAEVVDYEMERPAYKIDTSCPGSDLAGETASALASSSILFRNSGNINYADLLVEKAEKLYDFADTYRGNYSDCLKEANPFYSTISGYQDELVWGAIWLHKAKKAQNNNYQGEYLTKAIDEYKFMGKPYNYTQVYDDKSYGVYVLLAKETGDYKYQKRVENWLDYWTTGYKEEKIEYTPGGLAFLVEWGSLRLAANTAFIGFVYSDWLKEKGIVDKAEKYFQFGVGQINYILGQNPYNRSYLIGYGNNYPQNPHHKTAHGTWTNNAFEPKETRNLLIGALVGGPDKNDNWQDNRGDWVKNEVATSYNSGFVGALARMYAEYGGEPLDNISFPSSSLKQIYLETKIQNWGSNKTEIKANIINKSFSPARGLENPTIRIFIPLNDININSLLVSTKNNQCDGFVKPPVKVKDELYYVEVICQNTVIYPGGNDKYKKKISIELDNKDGNREVKKLLSQSKRKIGLALYDGNELIDRNSVVEQN